MNTPGYLVQVEKDEHKAEWGVKKERKLGCVGN